MTEQNEKTQKSNRNFTQKTQFGTTIQSSSKRKKNRKKKHGKKQGIAPRKVYGPPVKEYVSLCHGAPAKKPRTGTSIGTRSENSEKKGTIDPTQVRGLGGWRCSECQKPCKVKAQKPTPKEANVEQST